MSTWTVRNNIQIDAIQVRATWNWAGRIQSCGQNLESGWVERIHTSWLRGAAVEKILLNEYTEEYGQEEKRGCKTPWESRLCSECRSDSDWLHYNPFWRLKMLEGWKSFITSLLSFYQQMSSSNLRPPAFAMSLPSYFSISRVPFCEDSPSLQNASCIAFFTAAFRLLSWILG